MKVPRVIKTYDRPIKLWLDEIDEEALEQAAHLAQLPFTFRHVALMSDAHPGYGMPIGGVLATEKVVIPNAVGVDIGCGVTACPTSLTEIDRTALKQIVGLVYRKVPVGFDHHKKAQDERWMPELRGDLPVVDSQYKSALKQIGTLGGGNHFIEIQQGDDGRIWLMVHSGSRNIGYRVAGHYHKLARKLNEKWKTPIPSKWQLAYLPLDSEEGQQYWREMNFCLEFAKKNRALILQRVKEAVAEIIPDVQFPEPALDVHHNYAAEEEHFGEQVIVHRKGAIRAPAGGKGIIPGSQGTASYLVIGKGNPESFESSSHGAGRRMGRNEARRKLDLGEERQRLEQQGILHALKSRKDLDEAATAYKDIEEVIQWQQDLVEVYLKLRPLAVIKG